jgi:hypothetical protein
LREALAKREEKRPYEYAASPDEEPRFARGLFLYGPPLNAAALVFTLKWFFGLFFVYSMLVPAALLLFPDSEIALGIAIVVWFACAILHLGWYATAVRNR